MGQRLSVIPRRSQFKEVLAGHIVIQSAAFRVSHVPLFLLLLTMW